MFCQEYLIDLNVTQAAIWAGISKIAITPLQKTVKT
ncbi:terminase small subunit [Salmonella enterica]|nr:terminase small subunit [Salmonella enterica]